MLCCDHTVFRVETFVSRALPRPVNTSAAWVAAMRSAGDYAITCRARELLKDAHKKGSPAYWYHFTATPVFSFNMPDIPYMGAFHGTLTRQGNLPFCSLSQRQ